MSSQTLFPLVSFCLILSQQVDSYHYETSLHSSIQPGIWRGSLSQSRYYYSDYHVPQVILTDPPPKKFQPEPQDCSETGGTVCKDVKEYPMNEIFQVIKEARAKNFNLTSLFVDESQFESEPKLLPLNNGGTKSMRTVQAIQQSKGYVVYQTALHYDYLPHHRENQQSQLSLRSHETLHYPTYHYTVSSYNDYPAVGRESHASHDPAINQISFRKRFPVNPWKPILSGVGQGNGTASNGYTRKRRNSRLWTTTKLNSREKRQTSSGEGEEICRTRSMFLTPRAALNDHSEWKFIVNLGEKDSKLKQVIKVDVCAVANSACSSSISLPFGYSSRCKQKYIKKKLLSFDVDGTSTSSENFFVPSCCVCEIIRDKN